MYEIFRYIEKTNDLTSHEVIDRLSMTRVEYNMLMQGELLLSKLMIKRIVKIFNLNLKYRIKLNKIYKSQTKKRENGTCVNTYYHNPVVTECLLNTYNFISNSSTNVFLLKEFFNKNIPDNNNLKNSGGC